MVEPEGDNRGISQACALRAYIACSLEACLLEARPHSSDGLWPLQVVVTFRAGDIKSEMRNKQDAHDGT